MLFGQYSGLTRRMRRPVTGRNKHRRLSQGFHLLEPRVLLSADGLSPQGAYDAGAAWISPDWFEDLGDAATPRHVNSIALQADGTYAEAEKELVLPPGYDGPVKDLLSDGRDSDQFDWIVHFATDSLEGISSAGDTIGLLTGSDVTLEVLRGLGLAGQVLLRSTGSSIDVVGDYLAENPYVASYELDLAQKLQATPNDSQMWRLYGMHNTGQTGGTADADIDAPEAWEISTGSSNIVVGIIDTGVDYTHSDLAANIWTNPGEIAGNGIDDDGNGFVDDVHGYDFLNNDGDPMDDNNHGTHVAGTIAGAANNGQGVAGVNWSSSIMGLKFLSAGGWGYISDAVQAVNYTTMMRTSYGVNIRVTNNSWGGGLYSSAMANALQANNDAGILFVAAAGNSGTNNDSSPHYPSNYTQANVISVAATDHNDNLAYFSSYGVSTVDLAAPGVDIYSTLPGERYASFSGTSMATPHVAGVAALAWSVAPDATVAEIKAAILQGTDSLASLSGRVATGGRLNAFGTLDLLVDSGPRAPFLTSLTTSPSVTEAGATVTLTASGVMDLDGTVTSVSFFEDTNTDGQFDGGDQLLATDTTLVNSQADMTLDTTGWTPAAYTYFARAVDNEGQFSRVSSTTLTIIAPDDHGNNAATATTVAMGSTVAGTIGLGGDVDWFAFDVVAGEMYVFETSLVTLPDSFMSLYDQDGTTLLDYNDDVYWPEHPESRISYQFSASGTYYLEVEGYSFSDTGQYELHLTQVADDYGNDSATAEPVAIGDVVDGRIDYGDDTDFFAFDAVATGHYTFEVALTGLIDSMLWLYDQNGTTVIDWNDDISYPDNLASQISWTAPASGTYYLEVLAFDYADIGDYQLSLTLENYVPVLDPIADLSLIYGQDGQVTLTSSDLDGETLALSAEVLGTDQWAPLAYQLDQDLALYKHSDDYLQDLFGYNEKFFRGSGGWYFILPNGEFHSWTGSIASSPLIATFGSQYHADPTLLHDAIEPTATAGDVTLTLTGNNLTIDPADGFHDYFYVQVTATDGTDTAVQRFQVDIYDPPTAVDDVFDMVSYDGPRILDVLSNDSDSDGTLDSSSLTVVAGPANGSVVVNGDGTITYTPDASFAGTTTFQYTVQDDQGLVSTPATVSLNVTHTKIIDNGDTGYGLSGSWGGADNQGFQSDIDYSHPGWGGATANWTFDVTPGQYQVAANWSHYVNRATNSPFTVFDGATSLGTVGVNQELAPDDFTDQGVAWENLGTFVIGGNTLSVQLSNGANQYVIADGVRIERIGDLPTTPEIQVRLDSADVADGSGSVDFGSTLWGGPITKTFTVQNVGYGPLTLGSISLPASGFSLASNFGSTTLGAGESTSFEVQLDAAGAGTFGGSVSFSTNDSDESLFDFNVTGSVETTKIIDNGGAGYGLSGSWGLANNQGFQSDIDYSHPGWGGATANWTFDVTPGQYQVAANWSHFTNRATNSPFTVFDGATSLGTVGVNQELAPDDFTDQGAAWENLGTFVIGGNTLSVQLSNGANQYVIADGVRIERVGDLPTTPEIQVRLDSADVADGSGSVDFGSTFGGDPITKTFTVENVGYGPLTLGSISLPASGFSLASNWGSTTLQSGESTSFAVRLDAAGAGTFSGSVSFSTNDSDESPFDFNVTGNVVTTKIIDNGGAGYGLSGLWGRADNQGFGGDIDYSHPGWGGATASWTFDVTPGQYQVAANWSHYANRATNSPFTVFDGATSRGTVQVNQELAPNDFTDQGAAWENFGIFVINGNTLSVQLSNAANEYVMADGVRIVRIGDLPTTPEIQVRVGTTDVADGSGSVDFGSTLWGGPITKTFTVENVGYGPLSLGSISLPAGGFSLASNFGSTTLGAGESTSFEVQLDAAGAGTFGGSVSFSTNDSDESLFDFNVTGNVVTTKIIDNGDAGYGLSGSWGRANDQGFDGDIDYSHPSWGSSTANWTFDVTPGQYQVATSWTQHGNRATNSPFTVLDGANSLGTVQVNQELAPDDFTDQGAAWENLGTFTINGNTLSVQLSNAANEYVMADGVRIERVGNLAGGLGIQAVTDALFAQSKQIVQKATLPVSHGWLEQFAQPDDSDLSPHANRRQEMAVDSILASYVETP